MGWHVPGEMGGVWAHPIKLLDGLWFQVDGVWLPPARCFTVGPFWSDLEFDGLDGLRLTRQDFVPDGEASVVVRFTVRSSRACTLPVRILARSHLQRVWPGGVGGVPDRSDEAMYSAELGAWICCRAGTSWPAT